MPPRSAAGTARPVDPPADGLVRRARLSRCGRFRLALGRGWGPGPRLGLVGLNPSTADHRVDDPTTRRCIRLARDAGFGSLVLVNLFAFRATQPTVLRAAGPPRSPTALRVRHEELAACAAVVACWGAAAWALPEATRLLRQLVRRGRAVHAFGLTRGGHPRHPLYLPSTARPAPWVASLPLPPPYGPDGTGSR